MRFIVTVSFLGLLGLGLTNRNFAQSTTDQTTEKQKKKKKKPTGDSPDTNAKTKASKSSAPNTAQQKSSSESKNMVFANPSEKVYYRNGCAPEIAGLLQITLKEAKAQHFKQLSCQAGSR